MMLTLPADTTGAGAGRPHRGPISPFRGEAARAEHTCIATTSDFYYFYFFDAISPFSRMMMASAMSARAGFL